MLLNSAPTKVAPAMLRIIACLTEEHNFWLLLLAALICAATSVCAFLMLSRGAGRAPLLGRIWALAAGLTAGLGVWATHFVAMTAYDVGLPLAFSPAPLFGSLLVSLLAQSAAFWLAHRFAADMRFISLAGALSGLGVITMHYYGMTGVEAAALMQWDQGLVVASAMMSVLFGAGAFVLFGALNGKRRTLQAGGVLVLAICALHFTGMSALTLTPTGFAAPDGISQSMLGVIVGFGALLCVIAALAAAMADVYLSDRQRQENMRLRETVAARTAELAAATTRAEAANDAKSQFLANMSHELRTPLNAIIGYGEIISEDVDDPAAQQDAKRIIAAGHHLLALINDILDLSKIDAGRVELENMEFDAAALARDALDTVRPAAAARNVTLLLDLAPDAGVGLSDAFKIKQCLLNLLSNAVKFSSGASVSLGLSRERAGDQDWLSFAVRDTGIGMSEEQMQRLFQPFMQADASTARNFGGTGLGLTITQRFAQLMGGDVTVRSAPGEGSTFTLRIPANLSVPILQQAA